MKKLIIAIAILVFSFDGLSQQDKHFSMFYANPVLINPAAAGHFGGDLRLFTNFRSQWFTASDQPFRTFAASADGKFLNNKVGHGFIGAGISIMNDVSGDSKFTLNIISVPLNYSLELNRTSYLSLGIQPGFYSQKLSDAALFFDNQWTGGGFDNALNSNENLGAFQLSSFDLSAGLYYVSSPTDNVNFQIGVAGFHLSKQKIGFYTSSEKLYRNLTFSGAAEIKMDDSKLSFQPAILAMFQGPNYEISVGNNFMYEIKPASKSTGYFDGMSIGGGLFYRAADALILNLVYNAGLISAGMAYDINISRLKMATNTIGAFEIYLKFSPSFGDKSASPSIN